MQKGKEGSSNLSLGDTWQAEVKGPKPNKLRRHILQLLGTSGQASVTEIIGKMVGIFHGYPRYAVESYVNWMLSIMMAEGRIRVIHNDFVVLTGMGRHELAQIQALKRERREKKRLKKAAEESRAKARLTHENVKDQLANLATIFGKVAKKECNLPDKCPIRLDLVWYDVPGGCRPSHAFEVQNNGDLKNAVINLVSWQSYYPSCQLYLIILHEELKMKAKQVLGPRLGTVIKVITVSELHSILRSLSEIQRKISPSLYAELQTTLQKLF